MGLSFLHGPRDRGGPGLPAPGDLPPQRGFALPAYARDGYDDPRAAEHLRQIAYAGANWVQLTPTWYQPAAAADVIRPSVTTPTDEGIARMIHLAHAHGLNALLKPHLDLDDAGPRNTIRPTRPDLWFAAYAEFIAHYARLAARYGADAFAVGTGLAGTAGDRDRWIAVVERTRVVYGGSLLYAADHDAYERVAFWDAVDLIGVDAHWPLPGPDADARALAQAWRPIRDTLAEFAARAGRPVLFAEAGYSSVRGALTTPGGAVRPVTPDTAHQAAGYEALLRTFTGQPWWAGVHWWVWAQLPAPVDRVRSLDYSAHGKQAAHVVARWWAGPREAALSARDGPVGGRAP
ncbi:glycoside hydrolase family 113 [Streptomyces sp. NPDC014806]|uniref:glycoside hydrolase family 113 n=1 Tax=Streptomyces sp. NPDC014806 TaxID=3364920 RepID=UPI003702EA3D